jgi:hypothetical protein
VKKEQNGRESLRGLKLTVGCNARRRRRRRRRRIFLNLNRAYIIHMFYNISVIRTKKMHYLLLIYFNI